ncbi:bacillithiol biosynthesis deacetylase BshB2 [Salirhabdus salicampi]|uniref:bacillithiol biosynthesis deacetylase BshB2 n=1 Tax=Salirhabdus salicampi TaxID=476102 RepID=UPI0020C291F3|nr:bacillithiol biosynthesis deacetylase BshB2 [Salirhabdus salicampi]
MYHHKHVVVIYPHPDDESFGVAGTATKFHQNGIPVTYLCGTLGEMGRNMGTPLFANRESLPEIRKKELKDACNILHMDVKMLGYRDKTLEFESTDEIAAHLLTYLEDIKPTLVITHYPDYAVHPDHNAMGAAAVKAVGKMDNDVRPELWVQAITNDRHQTLGTPDVNIDTEDVFPTKMEAIKAHRSQAEGMLSRMRESPDFIGEYEEALKRLQFEEFYVWKFND